MIFRKIVLILQPEYGMYRKGFLASEFEILLRVIIS